MEVHEVCSIFPMMSDEEFQSLKADIKANGQRVPILTYMGKVIDGRNRLKACEELDIEPEYEQWKGGDSLIGYVVSVNLKRRHLSSGQKAACGVEIEAMLAKEAKRRQIAAGDRGKEGGRPKKAENPVGKVSTRVLELPREPADRARDQAASLVGTNPRYIQDAKTVAKASPDLHEKVKAGVITLPQAKREVLRAEKREELNAKAKAVQSNGKHKTRDWEIRQGDCIEILASLQEGSARLVFADPPYNIGINYGSHYNDSRSSDEFERWCAKWMTCVHRVLADDGSFWLLINHEWAADLAVIARDDIGFHRQQWLTWYESFGVNCSRRFNRCSRALIWFTKSKDRFVFDPDAVNRPSDRQIKYGDKRADSGGKTWDDVWGINPSIPRLVDNAKERIPDFPTQLPLALLTPIVGCASEPDDLVIDPFNGSGTTGEASIRLGRKYVGVELSEEFASIATKRLLAAEASL